MRTSHLATAPRQPCVRSRPVMGPHSSDFTLASRDEVSRCGTSTPTSSSGPDEVDHLTQVDGTNRAAFVVERDGDLIAVARYDRLDDPAIAEVAFVVADGWQHHGIASFLLQRLTSRAKEVGISAFCAEVLAENAPMLAVFHEAGFPIATRREQGTVFVSMAIRATAEDAG